MFPAVGARPVLCWCFLVFWKMPEPLNREIHDASTHSTSSWTVSLSQSLCVSHSLSVQPELKRILCRRLVWNITYLTCWWIDGCSQLPPSLLCHLHSGVSLSLPKILKKILVQVENLKQPLVFTSEMTLPVVYGKNPTGANENTVFCQQTNRIACLHWLDRLISSGDWPNTRKWHCVGGF